MLPTTSIRYNFLRIAYKRKGIAYPRGYILGPRQYIKNIPENPGSRMQLHIHQPNLAPGRMKR